MSADKALFWNDYEQEIDQYLARIVEDIKSGGRIVQAVALVKKMLV